MPNNNKVRWFGLALTAFVVIVTVISSYVWVQAGVMAVETKTNVIIEDVAELKDEGCLPARDNGYSIVKIETQLKAIQTQQKTAFKEILKRLPE